MWLKVAVEIGPFLANVTQLGVNSGAAAWFIHRFLGQGTVSQHGDGCYFRVAHPSLRVVFVALGAQAVDRGNLFLHGWPRQSDRWYFHFPRRPAVHTWRTLIYPREVTT